jgi:CubicO group peptidase (beta-lactamase class C family)
MSDAFAPLEARMNEFVTCGRFPGIAALVWKAGEIVAAPAAGYRDLARHLPMQRDTLARLASMSKPITTAAALTLIDEGRMRLSDPITRWLPEAANLAVLRTPRSQIDDVVPVARAPTLQDILTHTAGFAWGKGLNVPITRAMHQAAGQTPFVPYDPDTFAQRVCALPLIHQPGTGWHYGISADLLGVIVARAAGESLPEFLKTRIFDPIGMPDTGFFVPPANLQRFAMGYARDGDGRLVVHDDARSGFWSRPPIFPAGGGGLVSTVDDYLAFVRMLLSAGMAGCHRILSQKSAGLMTSNLLSAAQLQPIDKSVDFLQGQGFGLGLSVTLDGTLKPGGAGFRSPGSFSWPGGYATTWFADPRESLIAVFVSQVWQDSLAELGPALETGVYSAVSPERCRLPQK